MQRLTLLTETAAKYFETFGFRVIQRSEAPQAVTVSDEFRNVCPASATTMVLEL
jgi:N-acetylglutamate synthase-like GNAT family acetyltransferase